MKRQLASPARPKQRKTFKGLLAPCLVATGMLLLADAHAAKAQFTMVFDELVGGDQPTPTNGVYAEARFEDTGPNQVTISVKNSMQISSTVNVGGQGIIVNNPVISQLAFNLNPYQVITKDVADPVSWTIATSGDNNEGISGGGQATQGFDVLLSTQAAPSQGGAINAGGDVRTFIVTNITGNLNPFSAASFLATNSFGYYAVAKVQSVDVNGVPNGSAQIGVRRNPIPTPLPLLGAGMALAYSRRLRARIDATAATGLTTSS